MEKGNVLVLAGIPILDEPTDSSEMRSVGYHKMATSGVITERQP